MRCVGPGEKYGALAGVYDLNICIKYESRLEKRSFIAWIIQLFYFIASAGEESLQMMKVFEIETSLSLKFSNLVAAKFSSNPRHLFRGQSTGATRLRSKSN